MESVKMANTKIALSLVNLWHTSEDRSIEGRVWEKGLKWQTGQYGRKWSFKGPRAQATLHSIQSLERDGLPMFPFSPALPSRIGQPSKCGATEEGFSPDSLPEEYCGWWYWRPPKCPGKVGISFLSVLANLSQGDQGHFCSLFLHVLVIDFVYTFVNSYTQSLDTRVCSLTHLIFLFVLKPENMLPDSHKMVTTRPSIRRTVDQKQISQCSSTGKMQLNIRGGEIEHTNSDFSTVTFFPESSQCTMGFSPSFK